MSKCTCICDCNNTASVFRTQIHNKNIQCQVQVVTSSSENCSTASLYCEEAELGVRLRTTVTFYVTCADTIMHTLYMYMYMI